MTRLCRHAAVVIGGVLALSVVAGCSMGPRNIGDDEAVVATTSIWAEVVASVSCRRIPVHPVIPPGVDSHDFELSMRAADRMLRAKVVFANGLGLDEDLHSMLERASESGTNVIELGEMLGTDMPVIEGDPHIWMDPENVEALVPAIVGELKKLDLMAPGELDRCAERYRDELRQIVVGMSGEMRDIPQQRRKLVSEHRNLGYFAGRFSFEMLGVMIDSSSALGEADPRHLEHLRKAMRQAGVHTVFVQGGESEEAADAFVRDVSAEGKVVPLHIETIPISSVDNTTTDASTSPDAYLSMMRINAQRVAAALSH